LQRPCPRLSPAGDNNRFARPPLIFPEKIFFVEVAKTPRLQLKAKATGHGCHCIFLFFCYGAAPMGQAHPLTSFPFLSGHHFFWPQSFFWYIVITYFFLE
jgi:hypothetical protein